MLLNDDLTKMYDFMNSLGPFSMNSQKEGNPLFCDGKKRKFCDGVESPMLFTYTSLTLKSVHSNCTF